MTNFIYSQMKPNEQKIRFQGIANVFFWLRLWVFVILNEIWTFFLRFHWIFGVLWLILVTKSAVDFVMSIKRTYLELLVDS